MTTDYGKLAACPTSKGTRAWRSTRWKTFATLPSAATAAGQDDAGRQAAGQDGRGQRASPASTTARASATSTRRKKPTSARSNRASSHFEHAGKHFNVIDTPGYPDFIGQTIGALRGVDTAVIVINAHSGIEVNTRRVFKEAGKAGVGRMIVINKMDEHNIDFPALVERIREMFGNQCVLLNVPIGHGGDFKGVVSTLKPPRQRSGRAGRSRPRFTRR